MKTTGFFLLAIGLILTIYTSFNFFTTEKVVDIGKVEITRDKPHNYSWSPLIGIVIMGAGGIFLWKSFKK